MQNIKINIPYNYSQPLAVGCFLKDVYMNQIVVFGKQEWRIRDPYNRRQIACIIKQTIRKTIHKKITKDVHYEFRLGYTKETFFNALMETGQFNDFVQVLGGMRLISQKTN